MHRRHSLVLAMTLLLHATLRRTASAFFHPRPFRSFATTTTTPTKKSIRRRRPPPNIDSLFQQVYPKEYALSQASAVEETEIVFPLKDKQPEDMPPRTRFAPSPTGSLHVGGARTALYNWLVGQRGRRDFPDSDSGFLVRVEDTDVERSTKESEQSVLSDLQWLGLNWNEGPDIPTAPYGPYRQSERTHIYQKLAYQLLDDGKAYMCFCTKEELEQMKQRQEESGDVVRYDGTWRDADPDEITKKLNEGCDYTVRFAVPKGARVVIDDVVRGTVSWDAESTLGDFILLRSSGIPVYNFCVAVDDAMMGITTVIRAEEHLTNTLRQGLILDALGAPRPKYAHCSLILGEDKQKLSKRHGATSCNQYRLEGFLPDAMINYLALLGWSDGSEEEIFTREELIECFDMERVVKSPSVFDVEKLKWVNSQHLKMKSIEEITPLVLDQLNHQSILTTLESPQDDIALAASDASPAYQFATSATSLAKQMMMTTNDVVTNAVAVLGYNLPAKFDDLEDDETKELIRKGYFYGIATRLVQAWNQHELPRPDPLDITAAFTDPSQTNNYDPAAAAAKRQHVEVDEQGGGGYSYPAAYKAFMKTIAKELNIKGKNLFHPVRLALTGEMSGQDVTKQLSLLEMAKGVVGSGVEVVEMTDRMERLGAFLETIPEEFRVPPQRQVEKTTSTTKSDVSKTTSNESSSDISNKDPMEDYKGPPITALDIRVGLIQNAWEHPEADKLYCEEIDVGEEELRTVASGLRPYFSSPEDLIGRKVLVICNLKSRNMLGFKSHGMVLCASDDKQVQLISPPIDAAVGERVTIAGIDFEGEDAKPFAENKVGKKKVLEKVGEYLKTGDETGTPEFLGRPFLTSAGVCTSGIRGGTVS